MIEFEKEKNHLVSTTFHYLQENSDSINQLHDALDLQKNKIIIEGNGFFNLSSLQCLLIMPIFTKSLFSNFFSTIPTNLLSIGIVSASLIFLLNAFKVDKVHTDDTSWYYKWFSGRKKIKHYKELQLEQQNLLSQLSIPLENLTQQSALIEFFLSHKKYVHGDNIEFFLTSIEELKELLHIRQYKESLNLSAQLFNLIDFKYANPYLVEHKSHSIFDKKNKEHTARNLKEYL